MSHDLEKWQLENSTYALNERWIKVRSNTYRTPTGHIVDPYYVLEYPDWTNCLVLDSNKQFVLVQHYRPAADKYILEPISGTIDATDTSAEECIVRELKEEIGYVGGKIHHLASTYANPAIQTNIVHGFITYGGECRLAQQLEEEESLIIVKLSLPELREAITDPSVILNSYHMCTMLLGLKYLEENKLL